VRVRIAVIAVTVAAVATEVVGSPIIRCRTVIDPRSWNWGHHELRIRWSGESYPEIDAGCLGGGRISARRRANRDCEYQSDIVTHERLTP
jgi:hypothetical protein